MRSHKLPRSFICFSRIRDLSHTPNLLHATGHILVESEKMSKSKGNFIMLHEAVAGSRMAAIKKDSDPVLIGWTSDSTRIALADAGDGLDDANFAVETADLAILRMTAELAWAKETMQALADGQLRDGSAPSTFHDLAFAARVKQCVSLAKDAYDAMRFRDALKYSYFQMLNVRDQYREACKLLNIPLSAPHVTMYLEVWLVIVSPIASHFADYVWRKVLGKQGAVGRAAWPELGELERELVMGADYLYSLVREGRLAIDRAASLAAKKKSKGKGKAPAAPEGPPRGLRVTVGLTIPETTQELMRLVQSLGVGVDEKTAKNAGVQAVDAQLDREGLDGKARGMAKKSRMETLAMILKDVAERGEDAFRTTSAFDERAILEENAPYIASALGLEACEVSVAPPEDTRALPGKPLVDLMY